MGPLKENPTGYDEFYAHWAFLSHSIEAYEAHEETLADVDGMQNHIDTSWLLIPT